VAFPEPEILRGACHSGPQNVVFITLAKRQSVEFTQDGFVENIRVQTFGASWEPAPFNSEILFVDLADLRSPRTSPGEPLKPRKPGMFAMLGVAGDPLGLASGECPV
jgi:hypothetical protein